MERGGGGREREESIDREQIKFTVRPHGDNAIQRRGEGECRVCASPVRELSHAPPMRLRSRDPIGCHRAVVSADGYVQVRRSCSAEERARGFSLFPLRERSTSLDRQVVARGGNERVEGFFVHERVSREVHASVFMNCPVLELLSALSVVLTKLARVSFSARVFRIFSFLFLFSRVSALRNA